MERIWEAIIRKGDLIVTDWDHLVSKKATAEKNKVEDCNKHNYPEDVLTHDQEFQWHEYSQEME